MKLDRRTTRALALVSILGAGALIDSVEAQKKAEKPPSSREQKKLIAEFLGLKQTDPADFQRQRAILARLDALPALKPSGVKSWSKKLLKQVAKGRRIPSDSGRHHWWEKEGRGLYIVGGQTRRPKGLLIGFHGGGKGSGDAGSAHAHYSAVASRFGWVSICPEVLEKTECGWTDAGTEEWVVELIEAARRTFKIEADRVYFTGHSMGGYGTWTLGAHHADMVAGLAPSAGAPTPWLDREGNVTGIVDGVIPNLRNVPIVIFQSTDDKQVPPAPNQVAVRLLGEAKERWGGYDFDYWEVDNRGHGMPIGGAKALVERIHKRTRAPHPKRITWQPALRWKRHFYWLHWDGIVPNTLIDATRDGNTFRIACSAKLRGFSLLLNDRLIDPAADVVVERNGKEVFRGRAVARLSTLLMTATRNDEALLAPYRIALPDEQ